MKIRLILILILAAIFNTSYAQVGTSNPGGELGPKTNETQFPNKGKTKQESKVKKEISLADLDESIAKKFSTMLKICTGEKEKFKTILEIYPLMALYRSSLDEGLNQTMCKRCQNSCFANLVMTTAQNEIPIMTNNKEKFITYLVNKRHLSLEKASDLYLFFVSFEELE